MESSSKIKQLWRGVFNYSRQVHILYRYAYTKRQVWKVMCDEIAKRHEVRRNYVYTLFNGQLNNFDISIELEIKEGENEN